MWLSNSGYYNHIKLNSFFQSNMSIFAFPHVGNATPRSWSRRTGIQQRSAVFGTAGFDTPDWAHVPHEGPGSEAIRPQGRVWSDPRESWRPTQQGIHNFMYLRVFEGHWRKKLKIQKISGCSRSFKNISRFL